MAVEAMVIVTCDGRVGEDRCQEDGGDPFHTITQAITQLRTVGWSFSNDRNSAGERLAFCPTCTQRKRNRSQKM